MVLDHRKAIGQYNLKSTAKSASHPQQQQKLNYLAQYPGSAVKQQRATAMLNLLTCLTQVNLRLCGVTSNGNMTFVGQIHALSAAGAKTPHQESAPLRLRGTYRSDDLRPAGCDPGLGGLAGGPIAYFPLTQGESNNTAIPQAGPRDANALSLAQLSRSIDWPWCFSGAMAEHNPSAATLQIVLPGFPWQLGHATARNQHPHILIPIGRLSPSKEEIYHFFSQQRLDIHAYAGDMLKKAIKEKAGLDVNPDKAYFHRFHSAENDARSITGWQHLKEQPFETRTLTVCLLHNFSAEAQDNLDVVDQMAGIYDINAFGAESYGAENQIALKPSALAKIIWDLDFYTTYVDYLKVFWQDKQVKILINFYILLASIKHSRSELTKENEDNLLTAFGIGTQEPDYLKAFLFDINGYIATDMLVFQPPGHAEVLLYMPRMRKIHAFANLSELRTWIIRCCADDKRREEIAQHFEIADRQNSFFYDGIDSWLASFNEGHGDHADRILKKRRPIIGKLNQAILDRQEQRSYRDADLLIKSNNEIRLEMIIRYISEANVLFPNPITPFLSLGLSIDKALTGDTDEERREGLAAVVNDAVNLALLAIADIAVRKMHAHTRYIPLSVTDTTIDDIELAIKDSISSTHKALTSKAATSFLNQNRLLHSEFFSYTLNEQGVIVHPEILDVLQKLNIPETYIHDPTTLISYENGILNDADNNHYLLINKSYYPIIKSSIENHYYLDSDQKISIFTDIKHSKKTFFLRQNNEHEIGHTEGLCRSKRSPGLTSKACVRFNIALVNELLGIESGIDSPIIQTLFIDPLNPHLFKSIIDNKKYLKFNDNYFMLENINDADTYTLFKKTSSSLFGKVNSNFVKLTEIFYSQKDNIFYTDTDIGRLQAISGFSYQVAEMHVFCRQFPYDLLTYEEKVCLMGFTRVGHDAINDFLREGMPAVYITPQMQATLRYSVTMIDNSLAKIPRFKATVFRGCALPMQQFEHLKVNDLFHSLIFASSSADRTIAQKFAIADMANTIAVVLEMEINTTGHPIMLYALHSYEAEVLIERNSWFSVIKIEGATIYLKEIHGTAIDAYRRVHGNAMTYPL